MALVFTMSLTACGGKKEETVAEQTAQTEVVTESKEEGSEIDVDGKGEDSSYGEGIGKAVPLNPEEERFMFEQDTNSWLKMGKSEKEELVSLIDRSMELWYGFVIPDYDELILRLDFQSEKYYRNGVNEKVLVTVCSMYGVGK